jgi:hypothetical protein
MAAVVECIDRKIERLEVIDEVLVSAAVLSKAVGDQQDGARSTLREPALVVDVVVPNTFEASFSMWHDFSFVIRSHCLRVWICGV